MDKRLLAQKMLRWRELTEEISGIEYMLKDEALRTRSSFSVGGVNVSYMEYDYKSSVLELFATGQSFKLNDFLRERARTRGVSPYHLPMTDYRDALQHAGLRLEKCEPWVEIRMEDE